MMWKRCPNYVRGYQNDVNDAKKYLNDAQMMLKWYPNDENDAQMMLKDTKIV